MKNDPFYLSLTGAEKALYNAEYEAALMLLDCTGGEAHCIAVKKIENTRKMMKNLKFKY